MTSQKFSTEYLPLAPMLYRIAFHILEQQDEAEDAVQETFLKLWEIRDKLDDVESAKAYSIRILKNECGPPPQGKKICTCRSGFG